MTPSATRTDEGPSSARARAVQQLLRIEVGGAYVGLPAAGDEGLDGRTQRQATEYVAGITRWRRWLDFVLAHYYRGDYEHMEPVLKMILRVGLYDLLMLSTPTHAALNEAVELAKNVVRPGAGRLVNGVLRSILREKERLPGPSLADPAEALAIRHSHPTWLVRRWLVRFGPEATEALLRWNNERPVYGVRVNPLRTSREALLRELDELGVAWEASAYLDDFVRTRHVQLIRRAGILERGEAAVQDESGGLIVRLLDPQPEETVLDACAAPGGKTVYAAERMQNRGRLLALDVHPGRVDLVSQGARDHGLGIVHTEAVDFREVPGRADLPAVDRVLLDAPCSGTGVLSKRADLRWNRLPEELDELTDLQDALLDAAAAVVRSGGTLVYSTCTLEYEENEVRIAAFLKRHTVFRIERADRWLPARVVSPEGYLKTLPHEHGIDGSFAVRFRRLDE